MVEQPLLQMEDDGSSPISALQLRFYKIEYKTAANAYKEWHYLGETSFISTIDFGAYWKNKLEGAISYGAPNATELKSYFDRHNHHGWWEIKRLAMSQVCPKNSESRFIGYSLKALKKLFVVKGVVTYADSGVGHVGTIYKASGFSSCGLTEPKKDFFVNGKIQQRGKTKGVCGEWRDRSRKWLFIKVYRSKYDEIVLKKTNEL